MYRDILGATVSAPQVNNDSSKIKIDHFHPNRIQNKILSKKPTNHTNRSFQPYWDIMIDS